MKEERKLVERYLSGSLTAHVGSGGVEGMTQGRHRIGLPVIMTAVAFVTGLVMVSAPLQAGPLPPVNHEQDLKAKDLARAVVIYNRPYTGAIYADYVPDRAEVKAGFAPTMAGNEHEPMQVGLYVPAGKEPLRSVTLEVQCAVPCRIGHIYYTPADELAWTADTSESVLNTSFPGGVWPVDVKRLVNKRSSMPMYVLPLSRMAEIRPGRSAAFWVTFKTDAKIAAGAHEGVFTVSAGCGFRSIPNGHSVSNRTPFPRVFERRFRFKSNSDSVLKSNTFRASSGMRVRIGPESVFELVRDAA